MKTKNIAFTLAETLVVMGIIGVIAALTIPNLSQSTGNREKVTKVQKAYSNLIEAIERAQAVYGPYTEWNISYSSTDSFLVAGNRITEFMKLSKNCKIESSCIPRFTNSHNDYTFVLADGTAIAFFVHDNHMECLISINKGNEKYIEGKNAFRVSLNFASGDLVDNYWNKSFSKTLSDVTLCNKTSKTGPEADYCADSSVAWIVKYGNMDYLKLDPTTGKCPNGTTPTEQNPRCN